MPATPQIVLDHRRPNPKISVILIDWGVRESFHSLHYLNRQTADRDAYELIWVEFYDRRPAGLGDMIARGTPQSPVLDQWIVLGYPDDHLFHKHRCYNAGILAAAGEVCVICDSDAVFAPTFIEKLMRAFAETPDAVVHLDEARNTNRAFYPFNYPSIDDILTKGAINWRGTTTLGLDDSPDKLHHANYGACMAARRKDLLAIGGADEDLDFLGYVCGPYEMTFRLLNYGRTERWFGDEFLYHTWHPGQYGFNTDYQGPHDGFHMALLSLEARGTGRIRPYRENPCFRRTWWGGRPSLERLLRLVHERPEPAWKISALPVSFSDRVYCIKRSYLGFDVFHLAGRWYALLSGSGTLSPARLQRGAYKELWQADTQQDLLEELQFEHEGWRQFVATAPWPVRLWEKARSQPLYRLPNRILRKARRMMAAKTPAG